MKKEVILAAIALIFLIGCSKTETVNVDEALKNLETYRGKEIFVFANTTPGSMECQKICEDECCNECTSKIYIQNSIKIPTNLFCTSNGCETKCPIPINETTTLKGKLEVNQLGYLTFNAD